MKKAFTLAEVLITLGIIGVVAAITIPGLIAKYQKETLIEKEQIASLSTSESRVVELIQKMARGNVTPMTLLPLADDFLSA